MSYTKTHLSFTADLQKLPLGVLRKAQSVLKQAEPESDEEADSDSSDGSSDGEPTEHRSSKGKEKERVEWSSKHISVKRANKHAYVNLHLVSKKVEIKTVSGPLKLLLNDLLHANERSSRPPKL